MASERRDEGQVILLAGVLLVLGFILFSVQLSVLTNLGAQVGRETANPLLDDYLLVRRTLEGMINDELKDPRTAASTPCPDILEFGYKVKTVLGAMSTDEANRGQALHWNRVTTTTTAGGIQVFVDLRLSDGVTTVRERLTFTGTCTGVATVPSSCTGTVCEIR